MNRRLFMSLLINLIMLIVGAPLGAFSYSIPLVLVAIFEPVGEKFIRRISGETDEDFI